MTTNRPIVKNYRKNGKVSSIVISGDFVPPKKIEKKDWEYTPFIACQGVNEMIQTDSGQYADVCNFLFGEDDYRTNKEMVADQIVDRAMTAFQEHLANRENYLNKAKWNATDMASREAAEYGGNPAVLESLYEYKAQQSRKASERWYEDRLEELQKALDWAIESQNRMYAELDKELDYTPAEDVVVELPDVDACRFDQIKEELIRMSLEDLVMFSDNHQHVPQKYIGTALWLANELIIEKLKTSWRVIDFKVRCQEERVRRFCGQADWKKAYRSATQALWNVDAAFSGEKVPEMYQKLHDMYQIRYGLANQIRSEMDKLADKRIARKEAVTKAKLSAPQLKLIPVEGMLLCDAEGIEFTEVQWVPEDPRWEMGEDGTYYYNTVIFEI